MTLHIYLSTACMHSKHDYCQSCERPDGTAKVPGTCKFCQAPCICDCHWEARSGNASQLVSGTGDHPADD